MNILHLKYAVEIANTGSLNKAADNLYMGQPNLSRAIKDLEASLGITIFNRSSKGMVLTSDGEQFIEYAKKILHQIDEVEKFYRMGAIVKQRFSISVPRASYIAEAFANFSNMINKNDSVELFYKETNAMRAIKNILQEDYKLGIVRYAEQYDKYFKDLLKEKGMVFELTAEFKYVLILNKNHPLATKPTLLYDDLKPYIEIAHADPFVPSLPTSEVIKDELSRGINKRIFVFERASQFEILNRNKNTFMWVSSIPKNLLDCYGLVQKVCLDNNRVYRDLLIYRKDYQLTELDNKFIQELFNSKKNHL